METKYDLDAFGAALSADAAYQAADQASRAFNASPAAQAMTEFFLTSGGYISTYWDRETVMRYHAHTENRNREFDRVVLAFLDEHGRDAL